MKEALKQKYNETYLQNLIENLDFLSGDKGSNSWVVSGNHTTTA